MMNLTNMRLEGKVLRKKCTVYRVAVGLLLLVVPGCGVEVCESQDANLLFPNTPTNYTSDIKAKTWNKASGIRLASWMASTDFIANRLYGDRLMPIGENSIKIRNATRDDTGSYTLVQTSGSTQNFLKFTVHLEVLVPPTNQCIPNITQKGDSLYAMLPLDGCGIPRLIPNWTSGTQKRISNDISVLDLTLGTRTESYIACAEGNSKRCSEVDPSNLCKLYTVSESRRQENINTVWLIPVILVNIIIIGAGAVLLYCKIIKKKSSRRGGDNSLTENDAEMALIDSGLRDAKSYLIDQYKKSKTVAISPCNDENHVDISQVFCELEILRTEEDNVRENVTIANVIFSSIGAKDIRPIPVMIIGECGSGKSTWCKHLVNQWCQYHDNKQSISENKNINIPDFAMYEILLYIPLKKKLENSSFMEHVRLTLFADATSHYTYIMRYISEHTESVLLLIDGLDEVTCSLDPMVNLLKEEKTYPYSIVLTSRPSGLKCLQEKAVTSLRIFEIHGMGLESSKDYVRKVLDILGRTRGEKLNVDHFWKFANRFQVLSMCHNPFLCLSLIFIWIENKAVSPDVTDVVLMIVEYYLRRAMNREWYKATIDKVLEQQQVDILGLMPRTKNLQCLRDHGYLIKVISDVAQEMWCLQMDADIDRTSIEMETKTVDINVYLQTGILLKAFENTLERTGSQLIFSHPLLFDLFVALSIAYEMGEPFRRCITTKKAVIDNIYVIQMLCQVSPKTGQELISYISKIFETCNEEYEYEKDEVSESKSICSIECNDPKHHGGEQVQWLRTLMYMGKLSNAKLSILAEGLKFTNNLTVFILHISENKSELVFRLPILSTLQVLDVDIENCALVIDEEFLKCKKWSCSELGKLIIKSVNMDVKTTGCIIEAVSHCKYLHTLELCPNNDLDAQMSAISSTKTCNGWGRLAESIKDMAKLSTVRMHNLHIREGLPALLESLCGCPTIEILDLMNLNEIDSTEIHKVNIVNDRDLFGYKHHEAKQSENSKIVSTVRNQTGKILQLTNNVMSEKSWQILSAQLGCMAPLTLHIERFHQSTLVVNNVLQGIGKCKNLKILAIFNINTGNHPVSFYDMKHLHQLTKFTLSNITMPDSSWKELSNILARLEKLEELSLTQLERKNYFIEIQNLPKLKFLELRDVHLEDRLWPKLGDEVMKLPNLETLELVSCKMTEQAYVSLSDKLQHTSFDVETKSKSKLTGSEIVSLDMIAHRKEKDVSGIFACL